MKSKTKYKKIASHEAQKGTFKKCLLLYSGGLDTSVMLKWIQDHYEVEVIALTIDIGQAADNLEVIKKKALALGASKAIVYDAKDEFAETILAKAIKANADYQGGYTLSTPLGRVIISKIATRMANKYDCTVIAHGSTGKGNDQVRFEGYITTLNPKLQTIAPVREWAMGRDEQIKYAKKHNIPVEQSTHSPYSYDENMWGNTGEGGEIENPRLIPKTKKILKWCTSPEDAAGVSEIIEIEFDQGIPVAINGEKRKLSEVVLKCNALGSKHGIGVFNLIEDRIVGLKVRGIYENPGAHILVSAHKKLEMLVSTREENELKSILDQKWAYLTYGAKWYDPVMYHIHAYQNSQNRKVKGVVKVKLYKGCCTVVALTSPYSLFKENLATFNKDASFNQNSAAGFVELWNLPQKIAHNTYDWKNELDKQ